MNMQASKVDVVGLICRYENGAMTDEEIDEFFQYLLDSNFVYELQGSYMRTARRLVDEGRITRRYDW